VIISIFIRFIFEKSEKRWKLMWDKFLTSKPEHKTP